MCLMHLCLHVAVDMGHSVCPLTSYKYKLVLGARDVQISCSREGRVFTNQWWTNSGLPASQTSLLLSGAPSAEQASWAALISSVVFFLFYFFFRSESRWGTCVCVWDAGMHGANPPLSSNAWTVSKTLLLLLLPSMLIRRGLGWGGGGCTDVIQGWDHKVQNAPIVRDDICCAHIGLNFKVSTENTGT